MPLSRSGNLLGFTALACSSFNSNIVSPLQGSINFSTDSRGVAHTCQAKTCHLNTQYPTDEGQKMKLEIPCSLLDIHKSLT